MTSIRVGEVKIEKEASSLTSIQVGEVKGETEASSSTSIRVKKYNNQPVVWEMY